MSNDIAGINTYFANDAYHASVYFLGTEEVPTTRPIQDPKYRSPGFPARELALDHARLWAIEEGYILSTEA